MERLKAQLEKEWGDGFFYGLRNGVFDEDQYIRFTFFQMNRLYGVIAPCFGLELFWKR